MIPHTEGAILVKSCPEQAYLDNQATFNKKRKSIRFIRAILKSMGREYKSPYNTVESEAEACLRQLLYVYKRFEAKHFLERLK